MPRTLKPGERHMLGNGIEIEQRDGHYVEWDVDARGRRHGAWTVRGFYEIPEPKAAPEPVQPEHAFDARRERAQAEADRLIVSRTMALAIRRGVEVSDELVREATQELLNERRVR